MGIIIIGIIIWVIYAIANSERSTPLATGLSETELKEYYENGGDLFTKHREIIAKYSNKIQIYSRHHYEIENKVRDCLNEIFISEDDQAHRPHNSYLSIWKSTISQKNDYKSKIYLQLSEDIEGYLRDKEQFLKTPALTIKSIFLNEDYSIPGQSLNYPGYLTDSFKSIEKKFYQKLQTYELHP